MPRLKRLSGKEVLKILSLCDFYEISRRGSHVKVRRMGVTGEKETLTVPVHDELDTGTLRAIYRQVLRYIPEKDLHGHFYLE
jgi:predicted RNA binding protein YcfA (HicA-like mRNA interferase family)